MESIITELREAIGSANVITGSDLAARYDHIWRMDQELKALAATLPRSTSQVSEILKVCHRNNCPVVVHGGLTNLVGSTKTKGNEIVISLEKLNQIEEVDVQSRTITAQAGVTIESIQKAAEDQELLFPLNFGAKGSAQIGGAISTNAGGLRVLKYGMTRHLVLGLEVVLADGTIVNSLKKIVKDNSAYDIKQLFIGSEGTLGIITRAVLKLEESPKSRNSAFVMIQEYTNVVNFLKYMDKGLAGTLSGYELIWPHTYKTSTSLPVQVRPPLPHSDAYYVLVESLGTNQEGDRDKMEELLTQALEDDIIQDGVMALSDSDLNWFWTIREDVHAFVSQIDYDQHFDISLPIPLIGEVIGRIVKNLKRLEDVTEVFCFGHVADGNIHLVVGKKVQTQELIHEVNQIIYGELTEIGGSISAEHGIGEDKKAYLHLCRKPEEVATMKSLKRLLDPKNILNPGKVIDM